MTWPPGLFRFDMSELRTDGSVVGYQDPAYDGFAISASDTVDLARTTRGVFVGTGGDLKVTLVGGSTVLMRNLGSGCLLPIQATRVFATETTASDLVGLV